jgi:protein TonB
MSELQSVALLPRRDPARRFDRRAIAASVLAHVALLLLLIPFPWASPRDEPEPIPVTVEFVDAEGSSGVAGGGSAAEASSTGADAPAAEAVAAPAEPATRPAETASVTLAVVPPPPKPRPKPVARPQPKPPVQQSAQARTPTPPGQQVAQLPPASLPPLPQQTVPNTQATGSAAGGVSGAVSGAASGGAAGRGVQGTGVGSFGSGNGPGDDYLNRVRRWIAKYKKYPPEAMKRKQEGTVLVAFTLARDGTVLSVDIERSSGVPVIDQAVFDMMRRASPVPPVPPHYAGTTLSIAMPIRYSIGFLDKLF